MHFGSLVCLTAVSIGSVAYAQDGSSPNILGRVKGGGGIGGSVGGGSGSGSGSGSGAKGGGTYQTTTLYVSPQGNDAWSGASAAPNSTKTDGPKATLEGARDLLRTLIKTGKVGPKGAVVNVLPGSYRLSRSFQLGAADSGTDAAPITYRGTVQGSVELSGGVEVKTWKPVSNYAILARLSSSVRNKVVEADLASLGVTDLGTRVRIGFNGARPPGLAELYFENEPMQVAQWPNSGWARTSTATIPADWSFGYTGSRPAGWASQNDVWVHGFFCWDWADFYERVSALDTAKGLVRTQGTPSYGFRAGARYVFCNVLEELDAPGEYYMDSARGKVYFLPPQRQSDGRTVVGTLAGPLVQLDKASHLRFENLTLRFTRGDGYSLSRCDDVSISGCNISGVGMHGVETTGVTRVTVKSSDISSVGRSGIVMQGGDRTALTSGANVIDNCHIAATGRIVKTSESAIVLTGVGTAVRNCSVHDIPQMAIRLWGNNHVVESNEFYNTCLETSDSAAIYMGRDFSEQGNVFQNNYFHDIQCVVEKNTAPGATNSYQVAAVMLDDFASGATVYGNILQRVDVGVLIGGGRDNLVQNNAFLDCRLGVQVDARGLDWAAGSFTDPNSDLLRSLKASAYQSSAYRKAYPNLANVLQDAPDTPKRNVLQSNVTWIGAWLWAASNYPAALNKSVNNLVGVDPGFTNLAGLDLTPKTKSAAANAGFKAVKAKTCGLKVDAFRTTLPSNGQEPRP